MEQDNRQINMMRQYFLGALSEAEQEALEAQYLTNDDAFEDMVRVEHQLVDSYVQGRLTPDERACFEQYYMAHPDRRERVQFAAALQKKIQHERNAIAEGTHSSEPDSMWQKVLAFLRGEHLGLVGAFVAAMVLLAIGLSYYFRPRQGIDPNIAQASPQPTLVTPSPVPPSVSPGSSPSPKGFPIKGTGTKKPSESPTPSLPQDQSHTPVIAQPSPLETIATLSLTLGISAQESPKLELAQRIKQVRLQLNLDRQTYDGYQATVRGLDGKEILTRQAAQLRPINNGVSLTFLLPASLFTTGTYSLLLSGVNDKGVVSEVTTAFFKIEKK